MMGSGSRLGRQRPPDRCKRRMNSHIVTALNPSRSSCSNPSPHTHASSGWGEARLYILRHGNVARRALPPEHSLTPSARGKTEQTLAQYRRPPVIARKVNARGGLAGVPVNMPQLLLKAARLRFPAAVQDIDFRHPRGLDRGQILDLAEARWAEHHRAIVITLAGWARTSVLVIDDLLPHPPDRRFGWRAVVRDVHVRKPIAACETESPRSRSKVPDGRYRTHLGQIRPTCFGGGDCDEPRLIWRAWPRASRKVPARGESSRTPATRPAVTPPGTGSRSAASVDVHRLAEDTIDQRIFGPVRNSTVTCCGSSAALIRDGGSPGHFRQRTTGGLTG